MKLTKCENRHFYDADRYDTCPHCDKAARGKAGQGGSVGPSAGKPKADKPNSGSPKISSKRNTLSPHTGSIWNQNADRKTESIMDKFDASDEVIDSEQAAESGESAETADLPISESQPQPSEETEMPATEPDDEVAQTREASVPEEELITEAAPQEDPAVEDFLVETRDAEDEDVSEAPAPQESLQLQINAVSSHGPTEDLKTMAFYNFTDVEPVVGWLVCISGEYFGQSFNLKIGQNFIGRALTMDVPLAKDTSVSRNKHAIVTYDPQNRVFFIGPGESSGMTYCNGNLLLAHQPLEAYDKIKLGKSEFVFIPCCGEQFSWEDYVH